MTIDEKYYEAIDFFQKYPDKWQDLINGIVAKRNRGFEEYEEAKLSPNIQDRNEVADTIMKRMTAFNNIAQEFSGDYSEYADSQPPEPQDPDPNSQS